MKIFIFILLVIFTAFTCRAQKYFLFDRRMKEPVRAVDVFNAKDTEKGQFAIERQNVDSVIYYLEQVKVMLHGVHLSKFDSFSWKIGSTTLIGTIHRAPYGDRYNVALEQRKVTISLPSISLMGDLKISRMRSIWRNYWIICEEGNEYFFRVHSKHFLHSKDGC